MAWGATKEADLDALRGRIQSLTETLERKDAARAEARDALRDSERAISQANRSLARLQAQARTVRAQAAALDAQGTALEKSLGARKQAIGRMLAARRAAGAPDALRVMLSGDDPDALQRSLGYLGYVSRAAAAMLADYRARIEQAKRLGDDARAKGVQLAALERDSERERERVLAERGERRRVLERIGAELARGRRQIARLHADEARLERLIGAIASVIGTRVERIPQPGGKRRPFSELRGRLRLPVRGELIRRFGVPTGAAGAEAKGVFIRAPEGEPVRAIAYGRVVFADWIRGFGNLLIVDHGESYLSIYANNEALLKQVGESVAVGEPIALTGASGGNEQTGLYFELRHLGRPFDPLAWVKLK